MIQIETEEEAGLWLVTYRAGLRARAKVPSAIEVADAAVEAWRERVGAFGGPRSEQDRLIAELKAERANSGDLRAALDAVGDSLPPGTGTVVERVKSREAEVVAAEMECLVGGPGRTLPERVRGMRLLLAEQAIRVVGLKKAVDVAESLRAACHQDLAAVREVLGAHNNPDRSIADCVRALVDGHQEVTGNYAARDGALRKEADAAFDALPPGEKMPGRISPLDAIKNSDEGVLHLSAPMLVRPSRVPVVVEAFERKAQPLKKRGKR